MITPEQTRRQKDLLPRGWGRFGKAIDSLADVSDPDEQLIAACVTLNPTFQHRTVTLAGGLVELTGSTNVVVAATDRRVLVVSTAVNGAPRGHVEIAYVGLEIVQHDRREITLRWDAGEARFRGAAKTMLGPLVEALNEQLGSPE
jgi:hypothetical protein